MSITFGKGLWALESLLTARQIGRRRRREREERKERCTFVLLISSFFLSSCTSPTGIGIVAILSFVSDDG
jgi:hypothetical protein